MLTSLEHFSDVLNNVINGIDVDKFRAYFNSVPESALRNNLLFPLPVTARLLGFDQRWENSQFGENVVLENSEVVMFDRLIIFWTGDSEGDQPSMYYLKREMVEKNVQKLEELFSHGVLGKVRLFIRGCSEKQSYFVPFYFSEMNSSFFFILMQDRNIAI